MTELYVLENGVRVVLDPIASLETAALGVWVRAGSVDETLTQLGVAHLLEHMAFKGTQNRTALEIAETIEAVGGYLNAATSHYRTGYYARVLKDDTPLALQLLADILLNPIFDESELQKEKGVVVQEIGEAADTPDDLVFELVMEAAWGDHPLGKPILGTKESVRAQTSDSLKGFMARTYNPATTVIAVSGAFDERALRDVIAAEFSAFRRRDAKSIREEPKFIGGSLGAERDIEQTHVTVAVPGVSARDPEFYAARLFTEILGGGMTSRLFQKIREERGLAYSVYAYCDAFDDCGLLGAYAGVDEDNAVAAMRLVRSEISSLADGPTTSELERARAMLRANLLMGLESPAARIEAASAQVFTFGRMISPQDLVDGLNAVEAGDIARLAHQMLSSSAAISLVGPGDLNAVEKAFLG